MAPNSGYVLGTDVFSVRKPGDWNLLVNAGIKFILIKASEDTNPGTNFAENWQMAKSVGLLRGAFHFLHWDKNNIKEQADYFIQTIGADKGELPPVLDLEDIYKADKSVKAPARDILIVRVKKWLEIVESAFGKRPIVYTNLPFIEKYLIKAPWIQDYLFWPALFLYKPGTQTTYNDPNDGPASWPAQMEGIKPWAFWHWSGNGRIKGFPSNQDVDLHYFRGSYDELLEFTKTSSSPAISPVTGGTLGFREVDKNPRSDSDRPSGVDRLNYSKYAECFARIILNHETSTPLTIGIYGQWGQGKSFLMGKIREELKKSKKQKTPVSLPATLKKFKLDAVLTIVYSMLEKVTVDNMTRSAKSISEHISKWSRIFNLIIRKPRIISRTYNQWAKARTKRRREKVEFHIVEFNAWAYAGTDHLWAGLVTQLYRDAEKYFGLQLVIARLWRSLKRSLPKSSVIFGFYALLGLGISRVVNSEEINKTFGDLANAVKTFGVSALGGAGLAGLPVLWTTLKDFIDNLFLTRSKNLQNLAARPDFRAQVGVMADIKDEIRFIGNLLRKGKQGHPTRFILFIDDLDRCEHKKAVEVLQAIMLLLSDDDGAPFVIFMGIDDRVIVRAIEANYGDVLVKAGIKGYEYLDKIVQIPFVIPPPSTADISNYVDSLVWTDEEKRLIREEEDKKRRSLEQKSTGGKEGAAYPVEQMAAAKQLEAEKVSSLIAIGVSLTQLERKIIEECTIYLTKNPRKIKRFINIYRFSRLLMPETYRQKAIHWFLMTEQWPLHVAWIIEYIINDQQTKNKFKDKYMSDVHTLAKKDIYSKDMESFLAIDADPDEFRQFILSNNFSINDVLQLLPYTFNLNTSISSAVSQQALKATEPKPKPKRKKPATQKKQAVAVQSK